MFCENALRKFLGVVSCLYLTIIVSLPLPILAFLYLTLNLFDEVTYLKIASWVQGSFIHNICFLLEVICKVKVRITGNVTAVEPALVLSNHLSHDWVHIYSYCMRKGTLSSCRCVIKESIKHAPGFGLAMVLTKWPFVSRDFKKDEKTLFSLFSTYKKANLPVQLWIFPEGTRISKSKLEQSQEYAKEKGYQIWKHVMLPRYRGFITALNSLKGIVKAVHEVTIVYEGWPSTIPGFTEILNTDVNKRHVLHIHLNRVPIELIPEDDTGRQQWLISSFGRKEVLLENFEKNKEFPGTNLSPEPPLNLLCMHTIGWFFGAIFMITFYYYLWGCYSRRFVIS